MSESVSRMVGCEIFVTDKLQRPLLSFDAQGRAAVNMEGYLLAPLSLFSVRQLAALRRRHKAARGLAGEEAGAAAVAYERPK